MYRNALEYLKTWKQKAGRKPLVIRGARQVGKSYLARSFAQAHFENCVETNLERTPDIGALFEARDPQETLRLLELRMNAAIKPGATLLFLDEIQAAPSVIPALRYFHELIPELHIVAAGSLLEFALNDAQYSMPVGRIEYLHLGPMQFEEYLLAAGEDRLARYLADVALGETIPQAVHTKLIGLFNLFVVVGGMPEPVKANVETRGFSGSEEAKSSIISTFKDDFSKYRRRVQHHRLVKLLTKIPALVGEKFKYVKVDRDERANDLAAALGLLCMANITHKVHHTSANGVPLAAESDDRVFKVLFLDVGLLSTALGLTLLDFEKSGDMLLVNNGAVCEQVVGQHLLHSHPLYQEPDLYYWARERQSSMAEVDYVIAEGTTIVPIEVKAGRTGTLKSLQLFLREKGRAFGLRINSDRPSILDAKTSLPDGKDIPFRLLSIPHYMCGQVRRLVREELRR